MTFRHTVNLGNSIIGVSLLSMPYCFATSGIILSILTIIISSFINRFACHLILKSARLSKRRNLENLAFGVFGMSGKLITEIAILGFLLGSCVAFFVVIGDLCPSLIVQLFNIPNYTHLRTFTMMFIAMFIALPLALRRRVDVSFSAIAMFLYLLLAMNLLSEAFARLTFEDDKLFNKLNYWNFNNYFSNLPIFICCLSCQPQLFEIFDHSLIFSEEKNALTIINQNIKQAIFICSLLYITVGLFGYLAFFESSIEGNLLVDLPDSLFSVLAKLGFLFTIIFSLPLCLFPCRTSLHSLIYGRPTSSLLNEMTLTDTYIPDNRWLFLTVLLIVFTICISIILPQLNFILGLVGSTTGSLLCLILPALFFINLSLKANSERLFAHILFIFGILLLIFSTFTLMNVDPQELTNEGQMVKNLNLSTNRIGKLIEQNDELNQLNDKESIELNEMRLQKLKLKELKQKIESNLNELRNDLKESKLQSNKANSGFINAVEMKKKSLSKERQEEKQNDSNKFNYKLLNNRSQLPNQIKIELINKTIINSSNKINEKVPLNSKINHKMNLKPIEKSFSPEQMNVGQDLKLDKTLQKEMIKDDLGSNKNLKLEKSVSNQQKAEKEFLNKNDEKKLNKEIENNKIIELNKNLDKNDMNVDKKDKIKADKNQKIEIKVDKDFRKK